MAEAITETTNTGENRLGNGVRSHNSSPCSLYRKRLADKLHDAERLIDYAAETGIKIDANVRDAVLKARATVADEWDKQTAADVLSALTSLSQTLKPVTAESLKERTDKSFKWRITFYELLALSLVPIIVVFSLVTFITSGISKAIDADITKGNELAVKLGNQSRAKDDNKQVNIEPRDLQEFAAVARAISIRTRQLIWFSIYTIGRGMTGDLPDEKNLQIKPGEANKPEEAIKLIGFYQEVRSVADRVKDDISIFYGAMGSCILPILYALLGTCAFLLRSTEERFKLRILNTHDKHTARFVTAVIGGAVVGLFPNFSINQTPAISPLAIAFLVGYALNVFFSFLDTLLQAFNGDPKPGAKTTE